MDTKQLIVVGIAIFLALGCLGFFLYYWMFSRRDSNLESLMQASRSTPTGSAKEERERLANDPTGEHYKNLKKEAKRKVKKKQKVTPEEKYFQAGMFSPKEQRDFTRLRFLLPMVIAPAVAFAASYLGSSFIIYGLICGILVGLWLPERMLDKKIKLRGEEIMFFLPLVIEQVSIGVSSSLDIGPCLQRVVSMADERDSHNVVTEMLRHVEYHVRSGVSLEDALLEVGIQSGHTELKHTFMSLSQVAKHGGEITRQLQELADSVSGQRETQIEGKIKKLELVATGPVAFVFLGFLVILFSGFFVQIKDAFG